MVIATNRTAHPAGITVYNPEVEADHTYLVADANPAGTTAVWVHNAGPNGECWDIPDMRPGKISHVWDQARHQLDPVWQAVGSKAKAQQALIVKMPEIAKSQGLPPAGSEMDYPTSFAGFNVTVRIYNNGGEPRLSTAFLTGSGNP